MTKRRQTVRERASSACHFLALLAGAYFLADDVRLFTERVGVLRVFTTSTFFFSFGLPFLAAVDDLSLIEAYTRLASLTVLRLAGRLVPAAAGVVEGVLLKLLRSFSS